MLFEIIAWWCLLDGVVAFPPSPPPPQSASAHQAQCLTGYMTDVQSWVDENGALTSATEPLYTIDVSTKHNVVQILTQQMQILNRGSNGFVKYLSLARCNLYRVPTVFSMKDNREVPLSDMVEYITMFGNEFVDVSTPGTQYEVHFNATDPTEGNFPSTIGGPPGTAVWSAGFQGVQFSRLRELDLRRCCIQILDDNVFRGMPNLEALYLSENSITRICTNAFYGLKNLIHLDISRNLDGGDNPNFNIESYTVFRGLQNLVSLDLSFTKLPARSGNILKHLGPKLQRLSICYCGLNKLPDRVFNGTLIKQLDVSGNTGAISGNNILTGTEETLQVLYANEVNLKFFDTLYKFEQLEILSLVDNEINSINPIIAESLKNLQALDIGKNRLVTWFSPLFSRMKKLRLLSLKENNINLITADMINDLQNISFIGLSRNFFVCNCHGRELLEVALRNEFETRENIQPRSMYLDSPFSYHSGFRDFNNMIDNRNNLTKICDLNHPCEDFEDISMNGTFVFFDYNVATYKCLLVAEGRSIPLSETDTCSQTQRDLDFEKVIGDSWNKLLILWVIPILIFPIMIFCYVFRRNFKYFCITIRNSAMLSLINKKDAVDDNTIFNYDVFVSYCNEDRNWVLDHLLPHVEKNCNVSVCLHERDFQVGLSILENIVSCMDRSRSIMLVMSQRFLLSQWCQFEMHLAQHRLLETRREDLILVLLEEIPRRLRPTTLHYLMLTKTYIVWPTAESGRGVFWRRLKKSLITHRLKHAENVSLA